MYSFKTLRIIVARAVHPRTAFFRMSAPCNFVSTQVLWRDYRANQSQGAAYLRTGLPQVYRPNLHRTDPGAGGLAAGLSSRRVLVRLRITGGQPLPKMLRAPNLFGGGWVHEGSVLRDVTPCLLAQSQGFANSEKKGIWWALYRPHGSSPRHAMMRRGF